MRKRGFLLVFLLQCSLLTFSQSFYFSNGFNRNRLFPVHYQQYKHSGERSLSSLTHISASLAPACKEIDWAVWDSFKGNSAIGTINNGGNNISLILNSNFNVESTPQMERYDVFKRYKAPVLNTAVPRTSWSKEAGGKITICFSQTVKEPVLLLASLGSYKDRIKTTISFSEPYVMLYNGGGIILDDNNTITGREGYAIVKFPGDIKCITINSSSYENFTDFTWGIPVCPDGTPKPASRIRTMPTVSPAPIAETVKPAQQVAAAVQKPLIVPKREVEPEIKRAVASTAVPERPAEPVQPQVLSTPVPIPKPVAAAALAEVKQNSVTAVVPQPTPKPAPAIAKPVLPVISAHPVSKPVEPSPSRPVTQASAPSTNAVLPVVPKPIVQNISKPAQGRLLKIEIYDFDSSDYDSVSLKLNGKRVGPDAIPLVLYKRYGSTEFTYTLELQPGDNTLEIYAISEGIKPFATVGVFIIYDDGRKTYQFTLKAKETTLIQL